MSNLPFEYSSVFNNFMTGLAFGYAKIGLIQPLWTIKLRFQQGRSFTANPTILYRGMGINLIGYPLATATQLTVYKALQGCNYTKEPSKAHDLISGFSAGVVSGAVICVNDFIMTQHALRNVTYQKTVVDLFKAYSFKHFFTGLNITCLREGGYATCFLVVPGLIKPYLDPEIFNEKIRDLLASMISGVIASYVTQPADTSKSQQQTSVINLKDAVRNIYNSSGRLGFFKGSTPRCMQVTSGIMLLDHLRNSFVQDDIEEEKSNNSMAIR